MWGITQHQVTEREAVLAAGALSGLYLSFKLLSAVYKEMKITRALDAQGIYRPKSTLPILGNTLDVMYFQKDRLQDWMSDQSQITEGKPWVLSIIGRPQTLIITSPEACEDVFKAQFDNFGRGDELVDLQHDIFGEGVAGVDGEKWLKQRRTASHMFSMKMLRDVMDEVIIEKTLKLRDVLAGCAQDGRVVSMKSLLGKFSSDVFTKIGFGVDLHGLDGDLNSEMDHPFIEAVDGYAEVFGARLQSPMWFWKLKRFLNIGDERMLKRCIKVATDLLNEVMMKSMESKTTEDWKTKTDLLTLFVDHTGSTSSSDMRDAMMNFFLAGKETTSFSLTWIIVNLNRHPRVLAKLRAEIQEKLPGLMTGELQVPTMEDLQKVPYIEAVLKESLRLNMTGVHRTPFRSTTLREGTFVPFGTYVVMSVYAAARVKGVWGEDAAEYNPDRWIDPTTGKIKAINPFQFITFGGGPHQCIGMRFAMLEMQTVIAVLFSRFDIKTKENPFDITYDYSVTLPVKGSLDCTRIPGVAAMWTPSQHANYGKAAVAIAFVTAAYVGWNVASAVVARRAVNRVLADQELYEPPTSLPLLGSTLDVMVHHKHRIHDWFTEQSLAANGRPWVLRIIGRPPTLVLTSPQEIEDVFKTQMNIFEKGPDICEICHDFFGDGIVGVDGEKWLQQRRTASHLFSMQMLRDVMDEVVIEKTLKLRDILTECARLEKAVSMKSLLSKLSSDVFTKIGFGVDLNGLGGDEDVEMEHPFIKAIETFGSVFQSRLQSPMWLWRLKKRLNLGEERELRKASKIVYDLVMDIMQKSIADKATAKGSKQRKDLITLFLETSDNSADVLAVRDTVINFFLAGKDTTSFSMSWMLVNMNRYPHVLEKIRAEINTNLPQLLSGEIEAPSMTDLQKLPYLEAAMRENLRLYMATVHRAPNQSTTLSNGIHVPLGTHVIVPTYAMGRMPMVWGPDAAEYRPERWIDEETGRVFKISPFKFFSFLAGPHQCIGMRFAMLEMQTVMAVLLSRFDIQTVENPFDITYDFSVTLPVEGPLMANIHDRSVAAAASN
ncbi:hypothetical protein BBO99_00004608 [Phytophthora kernoviae]|uniref:Cytochrome P450 n=1 Tax=Phytophthora kernoviae TaxID=325452 RepID=A0A3R7HDA5_9STRA|nr:hypothetical protein JM16_004111 [Phytophthora kernoviae]RLN46351.1 hypothetical protein BBI17_004479 [Phytophthora kernoviae]RLN80284.1 hypothetical protein BBO99_00004608 [Phytophthora kernoviae]